MSKEFSIPRPAGVKPRDPRPRWPRRPRLGWCAFGVRCRFCGKPVLLVRTVTDKKLVPIQVASWDGSVFYIKGTHERHAQRCHGLLDAIKRGKESDLIVEDT